LAHPHAGQPIATAGAPLGQGDAALIAITQAMMDLVLADRGA
jgi:hypothetical protein